MQKRLSLAPVAAFVAWAIPLWADSYAPYRDNVQREATGRFYAVVKVLPGGPVDPGRGAPVEVTIAERKQGSPPVVPPESEQETDDAEDNAPAVAAGEGDTVLGRVRLERAPSRIVVSSSGLGFVGLGVYGYNLAWPGKRRRSNDAVVFATADGTVKIRKDTLDLFSDHEMSHFLSTAGGVWWCGGGWFDDQRKQFVIVGSHMKSKPHERFFRVLDLESGKLSNGTADLAVVAVKDVNRGALQLALELVAELHLQDAQPHLRRILWSVDFPPDVRVRAAVALAALGDLQGAPVLADSAKQRGDDYSITHLPDVLGDRAAPVIREVMKRHPSNAEHASWQALCSLGAAAVPTLKEMLADAKDAKGQYVAADAVSNIGAPAKETVPLLIAILEGHTTPDEGRWEVQGVAAAALESIGRDAKAAVPALTRFRDRAKTRLDEVKGGRAVTGNEPLDFHLKVSNASWHYKHAVDALKKIGE